jgi:hypothetical protein
MEDQFDSAGGSRSAISEEGATTTAWNPIDEANPWPLAGQIRQLLGENCELNPAFFEEIWTSGRHAATESRRNRRDRPATLDFQDCCFAELSGVENFLFSQECDWSQDCHPYAPSVVPSASYAAGWLREPVEEPQESKLNPDLPGDSAAPEKSSRDHTMFCSMQCQCACELLRVSQHSTEAQIKAAYRRMAGQWHPDRLERRSEEVRALATQQMAAINEAYCYLRTHPPTACC